MAGSPLMLPGKLADLLNELGYIWPKSDEVKMFQLGGKWHEFSGEIRGIHGEGKPHTTKAQTENKGLDIDEFIKAYQKTDRGAEGLKDGGTGSAVVGTGLFMAAGLVLALKIAVIVQLVILLAQIISALAAMTVTFGASAAWIPVAKKIADMAINIIIGRVIEALIG